MISPRRKWGRGCIGKKKSFKILGTGVPDASQPLPVWKPLTSFTMKQDHTLEWTLGIFLFALFVGFLLLLHETQKLNNQILCGNRDVDSTKVFNQSNYDHLGVKCCTKVKYDYVDTTGTLQQGSYKNCTFKPGQW